LVRIYKSHKQRPQQQRKTLYVTSTSQNTNSVNNLKNKTDGGLGPVYSQPLLLNSVDY